MGLFYQTDVDWPHDMNCEGSLIKELLKPASHYILGIVQLDHGDLQKAAYLLRL